MSTSVILNILFAVLLAGLVAFTKTNYFSVWFLKQNPLVQDLLKAFVLHAVGLQKDNLLLDAASPFTGNGLGSIGLVAKNSATSTATTTVLNGLADAIGTANPALGALAVKIEPLAVMAVDALAKNIEKNPPADVVAGFGSLNMELELDK